MEERKSPAQRPPLTPQIIARNVFIILLACAIMVFGVMMVYQAYEKRLYKLEYTDTIKEYAAEYNVDPILVAAIIKTESAWEPAAKSNKGAIGLMQIMPDTGEWIAGKLKMDYSDSMLEDPETNIMMGCWYLNFLLERFEKDSVIAAYNAGHGAVADWLENAQYSADGKTLTSIPYAETEAYVQKVLKAYDKYKQFHGSELAA
jgi:soluble lytic murein transglycosylase